MKKLIFTIMVFGSATAIAGSRRYCGNCYYPYPHQPVVVLDQLEDTCLTKMSACSVKQSGRLFLYKFNYGYKENRVMIFSNGKSTRYIRKGVGSHQDVTDLSNLKASNAAAAVGGSKDKVTDEKSTALEICKTEQVTWTETYGYCK